MIVQNCKLICDKGWWFIELPFNAGKIDLGDSIHEAMDMSDELKIMNNLENDISSPEEMEAEGNIYLSKEEIASKIKLIEDTKQKWL